MVTAVQRKLTLSKYLAKEKERCRWPYETIMVDPAADFATGCLRLVHTYGVTVLTYPHLKPDGERDADACACNDHGLA